MNNPLCDYEYYCKFTAEEVAMLILLISRELIYNDGLTKECRDDFTAMRDEFIRILKEDM